MSVSVFTTEASLLYNLRPGLEMLREQTFCIEILIFGIFFIRLFTGGSLPLGIETKGYGTFSTYWDHCNGQITRTALCAYGTKIFVSMEKILYIKSTIGIQTIKFIKDITEKRRVQGASGVHIIVAVMSFTVAVAAGKNSCDRDVKNQTRNGRALNICLL
jgi:hypothetical protein